MRAVLKEFLNQNRGGSDKIRIWTMVTIDQRIVLEASWFQSSIDLYGGKTYF